MYRDEHASYSQLPMKEGRAGTADEQVLAGYLHPYVQSILKHKLCPTYICDIFNDHNSSYFLRQSDFSIPSYNTVTYGKYSLRYLGPRLWGKLPPDVRYAKTKSF